MEHQYIADLKAGMFLNDTYMVTQPVLRNTTRGDFYIAMFLSDKTGKVNCRVWNATQELYDSIPKEGFVRVKAKTELYQGNMQIVANEVEVVDPKEVNIEDFLPKTSKDIPTMFAELKQNLAQIQDGNLKALLREFLSDKELMQKFCKAPAAVKMHHAYIGGLLEHTHNMLEVAVRILPLYPNVQADLVLAGIFLHDICKTSELSYDLAFSYTTTGQLLGHIVQAAIMLDQKADLLLDKGIEIDKAVLDNLTHIILSHHGKYEFGSPKLPATPEALMVNYIDDLDAKMNFVEDAQLHDGADDEWTNWKPLSISAGTRYLRTKVMNKE